MIKPGIFDLQIRPLNNSNEMKDTRQPMRRYGEEKHQKKQHRRAVLRFLEVAHKGNQTKQSC